MHFIRSFIMFGLIFAGLLLGLAHAEKQAVAPLSADETALAYARACILPTRDVFPLISLSRGAQLRKRLESAHRDARPGLGGGSPDFSRLGAIIMEQNDDSAEVLVSGEAAMTYGNGTTTRDRGGMVVRLIREGTTWRVW